LNLKLIQTKKIKNKHLEKCLPILYIGSGYEIDEWLLFL